ncbi:MAG TPA: hypothetical protein VGC93_13160 [Thermoanaerobaculia bacterium]|jgi:hypothetical protein
MKLPLLVAAGLGMALWSVAATGNPPPCSLLARVVGPEDFEVDASTTPARLLVSSQDRRRPERPGAIFAVDLESGGRRRLPLRGRGRCSFHPHGVSLVPAAVGLAPRLYVVNLHDPDDAVAGCFPSAGEPDAVTSIEIFAVGDDELRFLQRLADPEVLTNANDLVALPSGDFYATNPPGGRLSQLAELTHVPGLERSKVVGFRCRDRDAATGLCSGEFSLTATLGRYANGIAHREAGDGQPERLYVAATGDGLHVLTLGGEKWTQQVRDEQRELETLGGDNLTWADADKTRLLLAVHPDARRFVQHSRTPRAPAPSKVLAVPIASGVETVFEDSGGLISAASTAACVRGTLVLGQVFGHELVRCRRPDLCPPEAEEGAGPPAEGL